MVGQARIPSNSYQFEHGTCRLHKLSVPIADTIMAWPGLAMRGLGQPICHPHLQAKKDNIGNEENVVTLLARDLPNATDLQRVNIMTGEARSCAVP